MQKQTNRFISVEANIGAGKSTLLPKLVDSLNLLDGGNEWVQVQEPVDDPVFAELLDSFYREPTTENRIIFQTYVTDSRHDLVMDLPQDKNYVIERSLYSDVIFCFVNQLTMECPKGSYLGYHYYIRKKMEIYPQISDLIYLRTDPEIVLDRIHQRGRECEQSIELSYLEDLHRYHEACLPQQSRIYGAKLHTYDWDNYGDPLMIARDIVKGN